ncbi:MAG: S24 family peptidase [Muribaculaceae bacterium]|nr:S24 family peptidase [Muribaculaceae bacterium]
MSEDVKKRFSLYLKSKRLSLSRFAEKCGIDKSILSRIGSGTSQQTLGKLELQSDLNIEWLLTGEGEMLKDSFMNESSSSLIDQDAEKPRRAIPFYDVETTGGYNSQVSSSNVPGEIVGYIQPGGWFDGHETAAIRHVGDSMIEYPNGCVLAVREVTERRLLVPGRNYVIETSEYRVTKRVQLGRTSDTIALYSTNQETYPDGRLIYEPFEVSFQDIRRIFSILGYIVNQSGEYRLIKP